MKGPEKNCVEIMDFSSEVIMELEEKSKGKLGSLSKTSRIIKDEIFKILADNSILIQYPIEDDELCAFVCRKKDKIFSFINSYIPFEKQIFAAAHELYHIWFDNEVLMGGEILESKTLDAQFKLGEIGEIEAKANRFAAMFLVPKDVLINELDYMRLTRDELNLNHIVRLMDIFGVPYKTMVRRLYEIDFITQDACLKYLGIPDRDEMSGVRLCQKRLQIGEELQKRTKVIKFDGLVDNALSAFEKKKITEDKLRYLLSLARATPEKFGVSMSNRLPTEEELLELMENEDDD